ncbi:zinc finger, CCHC-type containing protein [Tanacetum coccineum]|uniref:Zinc finger, CCHC-type containing protein n=1 Tax=Tanacetum coccineum TaxID=301880 RepID=A0ABQ4XB83_9ASTR
MTTIVVNNSVFRGFFEKQKLTGPNFIDWYQKLRIILSVDDKLNYLEHPIPAALVLSFVGQQVPLEAIAAHTAWVKGQKEIDELLQTVREFHMCKQEEGQSVSSYILKMKRYIDNLQRLGHPVSLNLEVSLILVSLRKEYDSFMQNYNMHGMGKTVNELHAMLKLHEQTLPKKDALALHAIRAGNVRRKIKTRNHAYLHEQTLPKKDVPSLHAIKQQRTRSYLKELVLQGLRGSRKLKPGALSLYMGNGQRATVEAIGSYDLCFPSGLVMIFHNCHYAPSITRGIILVSPLYDDGFINLFDGNTILVSRNNVVYFSAVPRDGIYEIDLSNSNTNNISMYAVSNKRAKLNLDSTLLWHCHLGHISKKRNEKLQHDGLLNPTDNQYFNKYVSCMSGNMA